MERPAPTNPARMARGSLRERMIVLSVSLPAPFRPRMDWKRIRMERKGGTFTLPMVMDTRMIRIRRRLRRIEMVRTFLKVMIFI
jgi:hypothetical protein